MVIIDNIYNAMYYANRSWYNLQYMSVVSLSRNDH